MLHGDALAVTAGELSLLAGRQLHSQLLRDAVGRADVVGDPAEVESVPANKERRLERLADGLGGAVTSVVENPGKSCLVVEDERGLVAEVADLGGETKI